jgi:hypothetical protein
MKNPIVITTLEEDFKKIGLIKRDLTESVDTEELSEKNTARRMAVVTRGGKKVRQKKQSSAERMMGKKRRRTGAFKAWAKKYARKLKRFAKKIARRQAKAAKLGTRQESVASFDVAEALKSHANLAIISENLSTFFGGVAEDCAAVEMGESEVYGFMAEYFGEIAESLANVATALNEGTEFDGAALTESFNGDLEIVLDGVDLYEEIQLEEKVEEEATDDEEMDAEDAEEEDDEGNC